jgi:hypothetical protein
MVKLFNEIFRFYGTWMCITMFTPATTEASQNALEADVGVRTLFPYNKLSYHPEVNYFLSSAWL